MLFNKQQDCFEEIPMEPKLELKYFLIYIQKCSLLFSDHIGHGIYSPLAGDKVNKRKH